MGLLPRQTEQTYRWQRPIPQPEPPKVVEARRDLDDEEQRLVNLLLRVEPGSKPPSLAKLADLVGCPSKGAVARKVWVHRRLRRPNVQAALVGGCRDMISAALPHVTRRLIETALNDRSSMARNVAAQMLFDRAGLQPIKDAPDRQPSIIYEIEGFDPPQDQGPARSMQDSLQEQELASWREPSGG